MLPIVFLGVSVMGSALVLHKLFASFRSVLQLSEDLNPQRRFAPPPVDAEADTTSLLRLSRAIDSGPGAAVPKGSAVPKDSAVLENSAVLEDSSAPVATP